MTIVQNACATVPGFADFYKKFVRQMTIKDRAESTWTNYGRSLACLSLHYNCLPTLLSLDQIEEYLYLIKQKNAEGSDSPFKFMICALRFAYRMEGMKELPFKLPAIRRRKKLPVVLSKQEMAALMNIPCMMTHRVLIAVLYGCGLRCGEVRNLKVEDIDVHRQVVHVRQSKGRKDRYVPMGKTLTAILEKYIALYKPVCWLFSGVRSKGRSTFFATYDQQYGKRSVQWAIERAGHLAGITKRLNVHSLRHTYATHLLEDGVSILAIKELLGHSDIQNTMIYLHVAQINNHIKCSPLDTLEGLRVIVYVQGELNF